MVHVGGLTLNALPNLISKRSVTRRTLETILQTKLNSIAFHSATAAIATNDWPSVSTEPLPATGQVTVTFSAAIQRAGTSYPNSEMRVCETFAAQTLLDRLQNFERLVEENETLRARLAALDAA